MENLKEFHELTASDERNTFWLLIDLQTNEQSTISLDQWYQQVESLLHLSDRVPEKIKSEFNVARNLATYSWFCHSFHTVSATKAFSILKNALAEKYNHGLRINEKSELELLLKQAINEGAFKGSDILLKILPNFVSNRRDDIEQGNELYKNSWITLKLCSKSINQIFQKN